MAPTILCIEDSKTIQKAVEIAFAYEGFRVVPALTPAEGLQQAQQLRPALILLDTSLPGTSAYDVCQSLRQNPVTASVPVVMLAGAVEPFDQARGQAVGCTDHLPKPFETKALIEKARALTGITAQPAATPAAAAPLPTPPAPAAPRPPAPPAPFAAPPAPAAPPVSMPPMPAPATPPATAPLPAMPPQPAAPPAAPAVVTPMAQARPPAPATPAGFAWQPAPAMPVHPPTPPVAPRPPAVVPPAAAAPAAPAPARGAFDPFGLSLDDSGAEDVEISIDDGSAGASPLDDITLEPPPRPAMPPPAAPPPAAPPAVVTPRPAAAVQAAPAAASPELAPGVGVSRAELSAAVREIVEQVVWEVVPELAETLIREELDRLLRERGAK